MAVFCVINSIALAEDAHRLSGSGRSRNAQPYGNRTWLLRNVILPWYAEMGEFKRIVVVGEFEEGPFHRYVPCPQVYHNVGDALLQRQTGIDACGAYPDDWILVQHDDHLCRGWGRLLAEPFEANLISPSRWTRGRSCGREQLNDGSKVGYVNGHACWMRKRVADAVPWTTAAPVFTWDLEYTKALALAGIGWRYDPNYTCYDMEAGATPWQ